MVYCKCLKCHKEFEILVNNKEAVNKLEREGCFSCHSKNLEWKSLVEEIEVNWISEPCSKCSLAKVVEILNWEKIEPLFVKKGIKTKQELMESMNNWDNNCYCSETSLGKILMITGGVAIGVLVIGLIAYLWWRSGKKKV